VLSKRLRNALAAVTGVFLLLLCAACASGDGGSVSWSPDGLLPVKLTLGVNGYQLSGNVSLATDMGEFSVGAHYNLAPPSKSQIYVVLEDRKTGFDQIFAVDTGGNDFTAVLNGTTVVTVTNDEVTIDVTSGTIKQISFKHVADQVNVAAPRTFPANAWHGVWTGWDKGWSQSWYKPYALTRWAYSDTTIGKWYGIGFVWFLLRLVLTCLMVLVDTVLTFGFLIGQMFFIVFGPTGRDVIYGLMILFLLICGGASMAG
jgi:hypothetical protein